MSITKAVLLPNRTSIHLIRFTCQQGLFPNLATLLRFALPLTPFFSLTIFLGKKWRVHISVSSRDLSSQPQLTRGGYTVWSLHLELTANLLYRAELSSSDLYTILAVVLASSQEYSYRCMPLLIAIISPSSTPISLDIYSFRS